MIIDFCFYFFVIAICIIWFYSTGLFSLRLLKVSFSNSETHALISILVGLTLHVIVFSIYKTHFGTLNSLLLIVLFFTWLENSKKQAVSLYTIDFKIHFKKIAELIVLSMLFFLLKLSSSIDSTIYPFFLGGRDDIYYSQVSSFISKYGIESCHLDWANQTSSLGLVPYHYFELWLNSLISDTTGFLNVNAYYFITSVLLATLLYQTILTIISKLLNTLLSFKHRALSIALIFMGNLFFGLISNKEWPNLSFGLALYDNYKVIMVFIAFMLSWIAWRNSQYSISFLILLIIPIMNYGLMPVIICTTPLFFIIHRWILRTFEEIKYGRILLYYLVFFLLLLSIQKIFPDKFEGFTTLGLNELLSYYDEFAKIKTFLNYVFNYGIEIILLVLPFLLIFIPLKKYNLLILKDGFVLLMSMFLVSATLLSALLYFIAESSQIYTISLNSIIHLMLFICLPLLLFKVKKSFFIKGLICIYLISGLFVKIYSLKHKGSAMNRYSEKFLSEVKAISPDIHGQGIRFLTSDYYLSAYDLDPNCNFEGYYLSFLKNNVVIHTVTTDQIPDKKELHDFFNYNKKLTLSASYYLYFINKMGLSDVSADSAQFYFVKKNNIDFIVATKKATIPTSLQNLVTKEITDISSGEKLMLIDRKRILNQR